MFLHFLDISLKQTCYSYSPCFLHRLTSPVDRFSEFCVLGACFEVVSSSMHVRQCHLEFHFCLNVFAPASPNPFLSFPRYHELRSLHDGISAILLSLVHSSGSCYTTAVATSRLRSWSVVRRCKSKHGLFTYLTRLLRAKRPMSLTDAVST